MKPFRFLLGLTAIFSAFFSSSCSKYKCCYAGYCDTISKDDFDSNSEFQSYIDYLEDLGAKCTGTV